MLKRGRQLVRGSANFRESAAAAAFGATEKILTSAFCTGNQATVVFSPNTPGVFFIKP